MSKLAWKGAVLLAPVPPVMVSCGAGESANIITIAWTGVINTHPPRVTIAVRPTRHSYRLIRESGEFVINLTPASLVREADYCGIYTGAKVDKFARTGLHPEPAQVVSCPLIAECPLSLECRVLEVLPQGTHDLFIAEVVAVDVDESVVDESGRLDLTRAGLAAYAHGEYFALGESIGKFGFSAAKGRPSKVKKANVGKHNSTKIDSTAQAVKPTTAVTGVTANTPARAASKPSKIAQTTGRPKTPKVTPPGPRPPRRETMIPSPGRPGASIKQNSHSGKQKAK